MDADAARARMLLEESREAVVVVDGDDRVLVASRRARESIQGLEEGAKLPDGLLSGEAGIIPLVVPYDVDGRRERLVYLSRGGDLTAYEELRAGFTAAVSHELRTPLARLLSLLEMATLPGENVAELVDRARAEVEQIRELIDEVLFLSELESGTRVVSLGSVAATIALPSIAWWTGAPDIVLNVSAGCASLIVFRHRANIRRIVAGTERRMPSRAV